MSDLVHAEILSFEVDTPDRAILTFTAKNMTCRLALGACQVEFIDTVAPRIRIAMEAGRLKRAAEEARVTAMCTDPLPPD